MVVEKNVVEKGKFSIPKNFEKMNGGFRNLSDKKLLLTTKVSFIPECLSPIGTYQAELRRMECVKAFSSSEAFHKHAISLFPAAATAGSSPALTGTCQMYGSASCRMKLVYSSSTLR